MADAETANPKWNGLGSIVSGAAATASNETRPSANATPYPASKPSSTDAVDHTPRAKNFSANVDITTTLASNQLLPAPNAGVPIAGTPPAEYCTPIRINDSPIISTTRPVINGGRANRTRPTNMLSTPWTSPPTSAAVINSAIAPTPRPATIGIITGI